MKKIQIIEYFYNILLIFFSKGNSRPVSARIASGRSSRTSPNQSNC